MLKVGHYTDLLRQVNELKRQLHLVGKVYIHIFLSLCVFRNRPWSGEKISCDWQITGAPIRTWWIDRDRRRADAIGRRGCVCSRRRAGASSSRLARLFRVNNRNTPVSNCLTISWPICLVFPSSTRSALAAADGKVLCVPWQRRLCY